MRQRGLSIVLMGVSITCAGEAPPLPALPTTSGTTDSTGPTVTTAPDASGESTNSTASGDAGTSSGGPPGVCGNDIIEGAEQCEALDLQGETCNSLGFTNGVVQCTACRFDVSGCGPLLGMLEIAGGPFEMGSADDPSELPIRQVQVDTFWIDEVEVTVNDFSACVDAGECETPATGTDLNYGVPGRENDPINGVDWFGAVAYCTSVDKRLPTEAEWEKTARGTDARRYPWGNLPEPSCSHAVIEDAAAGGLGCGLGSTAPVGSKPMGASPYGAQDMLGNVWEWVGDWYSSSYDAAQVNNPTGPAVGTNRSLRGGSWTLNEVRATMRFGLEPTTSGRFAGFRCAKTPPGA